MLDTTIVIPNWNGKDSLAQCLDSLLAQTYKANILIVDNGSQDDSVEFIKNKYPGINLLTHKKNLGFAGGVNSGIRMALEGEAKFIALFNNDAKADKDWLKYLVQTMVNNPKLGIATGKFIGESKKFLDSTGDLYTNWGLPFPRGRNETDLDKYDLDTNVFGATGGASLYRAIMLKDVGLFDEDFFAYYEDVDISFRAQLYGWKVAYQPKAIAYHQIGGTSRKIKGFTTYQTMKNLPWLLWKNVPLKYLYKTVWRFQIAYFGFLISAIGRRQGWSALKGCLVSIILAPKKLSERWRIQKNRKVDPEYIWGIMVHDLPPNAAKLRNLRHKWWRITGKRR